MSACVDTHGRISFRKYPVELLGQVLFLSSPTLRPAEDSLLVPDTGGILGEPCGVSDVITLLQTQGLGAPDAAGGWLVRREEPSRAGTTAYQRLPEATPPPSSLDDARFKDPVAWCSLERGLHGGRQEAGGCQESAVSGGGVPGQHSTARAPRRAGCGPGVREGPPGVKSARAALGSSLKGACAPWSGGRRPSACREDPGAQEGAPVAHSGPQSSGGSPGPEPWSVLCAVCFCEIRAAVGLKHVFILFICCGAHGILVP